MRFYCQTERRGFGLLAVADGIPHRDFGKDAILFHMHMESMPCLEAHQPTGE
jgi:hypothetical protein